MLWGFYKKFYVLRYFYGSYGESKWETVKLSNNPTYKDFIRAWYGCGRKKGWASRMQNRSQRKLEKKEIKRFLHGKTEEINMPKFIKDPWMWD